MHVVKIYFKIQIYVKCSNLCVYVYSELFKINLLKHDYLILAVSLKLFNY